MLYTIYYNFDNELKYEYSNDKYISIIGRKNEMIVNSGGENIAPVPIEELITSHDDIDQAMVYGHGKPYLVALLVLLMLQ